MALALGLSDPDTMLEEMPYKTFRGWMRYLNEGPLFWRIIDAHLADIRAILYNVHRDRKRNPMPIEAIDLRFFKPQAHQITGEELFKKILILNRLMGGNFVDKRKLEDNG